jgi:hypothetical protein
MPQQVQRPVRRKIKDGSDGAHEARLSEVPAPQGMRVNLSEGVADLGEVFAFS